MLYRLTLPSCATVKQGDHEGVNRASQVTSRPSRVQERLIGALIPDALGTRTETPTVPLAVLPALSRLDTLEPTTLLVSTTRMDRSGRIHERILLHELGWEPGQRLDMDTMHGMILIAATPAGHHSIDHRGAIKLPAAFRRLCGIQHGPPLVLAAARPDQVMVVHPAAVVAHLLATHYTNLINNDQAHTKPDPAPKGSP
jgi:bifunctional DNA-binding transcriptional regulator/antitoxin component of YhaV-PrlF toxin-antitoxin module